MEGMKDDRRPVIGGGISVLRAIFDLLEIDQMHAAQGALRHGVLYDLVDRDEGLTDLRSTSVQRLAHNFNTDSAQAQRLSKVAQHLFAMAACELPAPELTSLQCQLAWGQRSCMKSAARFHTTTTTGTAPTFWTMPIASGFYRR